MADRMMVLLVGLLVADRMLVHVLVDCLLADRMMGLLVHSLAWVALALAAIVRNGVLYQCLLLLVVLCNLSSDAYLMRN